MSRAGLTVGLAAPAVALAGGALVGGWEMLWLPAAGLGGAAAVAFARAREAQDHIFPTVEIAADAERAGVFLRLTNLEEADTFRTRLLRVSLEDTLSAHPPWPLPWAGVAGEEVVLHRDESSRIEIGRVVLGPDGEPAELHFARAPVAGRGGDVVMPWPTAVEEIDAPGVDLSSRRVRAEIEIASERTGATRLVQVKVGVRPPSNDADVHLVSIDTGRARNAAA